MQYKQRASSIWQLKFPTPLVRIARFRPSRVTHISTSFRLVLPNKSVAYLTACSARKRKDIIELLPFSRGKCRRRAVVRQTRATLYNEREKKKINSSRSEAKSGDQQRCKGDAKVSFGNDQVTSDDKLVSSFSYKNYLFCTLFIVIYSDFRHTKKKPIQAA